MAQPAEASGDDTRCLQCEGASGGPALQLGGLCVIFLRSFAGLPLQIALASFYEDGGDEDILTLPQPTPSSISRGTGAR